MPENNVEMFMSQLPTAAEINRQITEHKASAKNCRDEAAKWDKKAGALRKLLRVADAASPQPKKRQRRAAAVPAEPVNVGEVVANAFEQENQ